MAYLVISDFKNGMDRRRPRANGIPGSLWKAEGCVISRGGDVEKAKKFSSLYTLPAGTFGFARVGGRLQVYASSSKTMPAGVECQVLTAPGSPNLEKILDVKTPDNKPYVIAKFDDGNIYHYYDGSRVTDLDALAAANADHDSVAAFLAEEMAEDDDVRITVSGAEIVVLAKTPGEAFTLTASATNDSGTDDQDAVVTALVANVAEVANVDAYGSVEVTGGSADAENANRIDQIEVDGEALLPAPVNFSTSATATANLVAQQINNGTSDHGYSASADGAVITITAPVNTGTTHNGETVETTVAGNVTTTDTNLANGVDYVAPVAQQSKVAFSGTVDADDLFSVTLNGVEHKVTVQASAYGTEALVHKQRVYIAAYNIVRYSELGDYDDFTDATASTGAGFIAIAGTYDGNRVIGLGKYQDRVAIFTRDNISTWYLETDSDNNAIDRVMENTGTISPNSIVPYGNNDVFYLDEIGVRSLRARDSSNAAYVSDVGSFIDDYVSALRAVRTAQEVRDAQGAIDTVDGRYLLSVGNEILTLSNFPGSKITAWTVQKPGVVPEAFVRLQRDIYMRAGDAIYIYGGLDGDEYVAASGCVIETAFLDAKTPGTHKQINGIDVSCEGVWKIEMLTDPDDDTKAIEIARPRKQTLNSQHITFSMAAAIFAIRATCLSEGAASLSQIIIHHDKVEAA